MLHQVILNAITFAVIKFDLISFKTNADKYTIVGCAQNFAK